MSSAKTSAKASPEKSASSSTLLYICWDVDATGTRLLDDICNIGAHIHPDTKYQQYIMPHRNISLFARRKCHLTTASFSFYRHLKETTTKKVLKTKSELFGLTDFLVWLEKRCKGYSGIILVTYEGQTMAPYLLLEGLKRYENLMERFTAVVKGFVNSSSFVAEKCSDTVQSHSLKTLTKILLNAENKNLHDAYERAKSLFMILMHLSVGESADTMRDLVKALKPHVITVEAMLESLDGQLSLVARQNSLTPIFSKMLSDPKLRQRAVSLRKQLSQSLDFVHLKASYEEEADFRQFLCSKLPDARDEDIQELQLLIDRYLTPNHKNTNGVAKGAGDGISNEEHPVSPKNEKADSTTEQQC